MLAEPDYSRLPHPDVDLITENRWRELAEHRRGAVGADLRRHLDAEEPGWHLPSLNHLEWAHFARETYRFRAARGEWPKNKESELGFTRVLGEWLDQQKQLDPATRDPRHRARLDYLDRLWIISKRPALTDTWLANAHALVDVVAALGRLPRANEHDLSHKRLGTWLSLQRRNSRDPLAGTWTPEREAKLTELVPDWRGTRGDVPPPQFKRGKDVGVGWQRELESLRSFVARQDRAPIVDASEESERDLAKWLQRQIYAKQHLSETWTQAQDQLLGTSLPGWSDTIVDVRTLLVDIDQEDAAGLTRDWVDRAEQARSFIVQHGRWPYTHADDAQERATRHWLNTQARTESLVGGRTTDGRLHYLASRIPQWADFDSGLGLRWAKQARSLHDFVSEHGRFPKLTDEDHERTLCRWMYRQRAARKRGSLPDWSPAREEHLDDLAPGWVTGTMPVAKEGPAPADGPWQAQAEALQVFVSRNGRLPIKSGGQPEDRKLATWLRAQRKAKKENSAWSIERQHTLDDLVPGWSKRRLGT